MAFDMGFDFRATSGYVTDPAYGVPVLGESYPHTYTNTNGDSINAGWTDTSHLGKNDINNATDARLAGRNQAAGDGGAPPYLMPFQVDLSSGSAPGAGTYAIRLAIGQDPGFGNPACEFQLLDSSTVLIDGSTKTTAADFIDASLAVLTEANWITSNTPVNKTFATTTAKLVLTADSNVSVFTPVAHFRLTLQAVTTAFPPRMLMLLGVGA